MQTKRDPERSRRILVDAAMKQFHEKGFHSASLSDILADTGLTRGALYHHFSDKRELAFAALDRVERWVHETWIDPLAGSDDPVSALKSAMWRAGEQLAEDDIRLGCPANNLAQEMSAVDDVFRLRIGGIYEKWRKSVAESVERGKSSGNIAPDVDPEAVGAFFVAALTGSRGLSKNARSRDVLKLCAGQLVRYLEGLRP